MLDASGCVYARRDDPSAAVLNRLRLEHSGRAIAVRAVSARWAARSRALPSPRRRARRAPARLFDSEPEAHYVAAFLNSDHAAEIIEGWMNLGLFGRRDINKRILDVRWPRFDPETADHRGLSNAAADLSKEAKSLLKELPKTKAGSQRRWMRDHLPKRLLETVEKLVKLISEKP